MIANFLGQVPSSRDGSNSGEFAPSAKRVVASGTVLVGGEAVSAELEVVVDPATLVDGGQNPRLNGADFPLRHLSELVTSS